MIVPRKQIQGREKGPPVAPAQLQGAHCSLAYGGEPLQVGGGQLQENGITTGLVHSPDFFSVSLYTSRKVY